MFSGKTIFISPLDWGLGHATRCVPLVRSISENNKVIIGVTPLTRQIFDSEFPDLQQMDVPAYDVSYSSNLPVWLSLLASWPKIRWVIWKEKQFVTRKLESLNIDVIISDNRFGLYSNKIKSVFITHQLFLKTPFGIKIAQAINKKYILKFNEVWVPDYENLNESLSGDLSHGNHFHKNVKYIGPLSRLQKSNATEIKFDYLFLLSGPEPHHSRFAEELLAEAAKNPQKKFALTSNSFRCERTGNLDPFFKPSAQILTQLILESRVVVCRSGYSTLMDLFVLEKKELILIPTKGQTEQEYLAMYWMEKFNKEFSIKLVGSKQSIFE